MTAMKMLLLYFTFLPLFIYHACTPGKASSVQPAQKEEQVLKDTIHFTTQVQPILEKKCSPCHFPGGKMYARMPFDRDTTILNHEGGILKRIKGEENLVIKTFILQNKSDDSLKDDR